MRQKIQAHLQSGDHSKRAEEYASCEVASKETFSREEELKAAHKTYEATKWVLKGIKSGKQDGGQVALKNRCRTHEKKKKRHIRKELNHITKHPLVRTGCTREEFDENCKKVFVKSQPKDLAKALIAQDLRLMKQAVELSDVAPTKETRIGRLLTRNYQNLETYITASIVLAPDLKSAAKRAKFFIDVMKELEKFESGEGKRHGEHISFLAIGDALNNAAISRLTKMQELVPKKERTYAWGAEGAYQQLRARYRKVPTALQVMPEAALFNPTILSTFIEGAETNTLNNRIEVIANTAWEFKRGLRDVKGVPTPESAMRLKVPALPENFRFPEGHERVDSDFQEYLYLRSRELQPKRS